jgi:hypothetical protein
MDDKLSDLLVRAAADLGAVDRQAMRSCQRAILLMFRQRRHELEETFAKTEDYCVKTMKKITAGYMRIVNDNRSR